MTYENAVEAAEFIKSKYPHAIDVAMVLAGFIGLSRAPKALGVPYKKGN